MTLSAYGLSAVSSGRTILHPTNVDIKPGERVGLVGVSGSGKSTLGHKLIDNLRTNGQKVAHVPQSPDEALDPLRSMAFHWREAEQALGLSPDLARQQALFSALRIEGGDLKKRPWGWSRGMQQRFVIAMALIQIPDLLVMDEPTSALDPMVAASMMDLLDRTLAASHQTAMLLITHDLGLAVRSVNRLLIIDAGHVVEDSPTEQFLVAPITRVAQELCAHRNWLELPC